jgi:hypothetical protein
MEQYTEDHPYKLLRYPRCIKTEVFSRVDRYTVIRYWMEDNERKREFLFYPSQYGTEEIQKYRNLLNDGLSWMIPIKIKDAEFLVQCLNQLELYGNGNKNIIVNKPVKPYISKPKKIVRSAKKLKLRSAIKLKR